MNHKGFLLFSFVLIFLSIEVSYGTTPLESLIPKRELPEGWALFEGPHIYTKKTLFGHIDGQAELYIKYGFRKSVFAIYQNRKSSGNQIELDIYDMGNVLQAFGVFSRFRNENRPGGIGLDSYLDDRSAFFYQGKYFVMLYATESNPAILKQMSTFLVSKISDPSPSPKEIGFFPKNGFKPGSIQYFSEGLLGHQFLKRGFQGTYIEKDEDKVEAKDRPMNGDKEFHLFLAIFKNSQDALGALRIYKDDLTRKGKVNSDTPIGFGPHSFRAEDPYQGEIIVVQKGFYLLGVVGFEREKYAENLLKEFMKDIR